MLDPSDPVLNPATDPDSPAARLARLACVMAYHQRSKHALNRYAAGPETLDWDNQPNPFRRWLGAELHALPRPEQPHASDAIPWHDWAQPRPAQPFDRPSLGRLLALSLALAAWKQAGPDRWAVRINPSSGNLHPTEAWLLLQGHTGHAAPASADPLASPLADGLYHYAPFEHALEQRAAWAPISNADANADAGPARAWVALSSIHWREAWKYGERAFRYCQLDAGHACGALRVAAALLGWRLAPVPLPQAALASLLGLDRDADFGPAEHEDAELLFELRPAQDPAAAWGQRPRPVASHWAGHANRLDRHPMYRWPVIADVARASAPSNSGPVPIDAVPIDPAPSAEPPQPANRVDAAAPPAPGAPAEATPTATPSPTPPSPLAASLVRRRRSAQRFDAKARSSLATLAPLLAALDPARAPFDLLPGPPAVHALLFAHRVDGLAPGAYLLPRGPGALQRLRQQLPAALDWLPQPVPGSAQTLWRLAENPALAGTLRTLNCHQALGSDAVLGLALLAEWGPWRDAHGSPAPATYRLRLQEAGLAGQVLYLEAEALGLAGTGIGCFFDDGLHQLIGLSPTEADAAPLQSVYHFTIGHAVLDPRIATEPPYAHLGAWPEGGV